MPRKKTEAMTPEETLQDAEIVEEISAEDRTQDAAPPDDAAENPFAEPYQEPLHSPTDEEDAQESPCLLADDFVGSLFNEGVSSGENQPEPDASPEDEESDTSESLVPAKRGDVAGKEASRHAPADFYQTDFRRLDKNLSEREQQEWNDIYASFRSQSILTGIVAGVDQNELPVKGADGQVEMRVISSLVVIGYRVKILIPENAVWPGGEERSAFVMRGMIGASIDYVVTHVDREGEVALGSRGLAMLKRRRAFSGGRGAMRAGDIVPCSVVVVGPRRCLVSCGGYDVSMRASDMSYTSMLDMREHYRPGQELKARVMDFHPAQGKLLLSVREAMPNPFDGAQRRHPVGSRRQAIITGKYGGGVFCTLQDDTICLCLYSNSHYDSDFLLGDKVIVYIAQYNYQRRHIYGRIMAKW